MRYAFLAAALVASVVAIPVAEPIPAAVEHSPVAYTYTTVYVTVDPERTSTKKHSSTSTKHSTNTDSPVQTSKKSSSTKKTSSTSSKKTSSSVASPVKTSTSSSSTKKTSSSTSSQKTSSSVASPVQTSTTSSSSKKTSSSSTSSKTTSSSVASAVQTSTTSSKVSTTAKASTSSSSQVGTPIMATSTSTSAGAVPTTFEQIAVYHHNLHRTNHSASDVTWSPTLASIAAEIASSCNYNHNVTAGGGGYGQNIAAGVMSNNISAVITELFYNGEEPYFNGLYGEANPSFTNFEHWGHFSQIVWKDTTQIGCAVQYCPAGLANTGSDIPPYFTVCNYEPAGNYGGEYADNIGKPLGEAIAHWNTGL